jgi:hypothetical protein
VAAPDYGHYANQQPYLTYRHSPASLNATSLDAAVVCAFQEHPAWLLTRPLRAGIAAQRALHAELLR